MAALYDRLHCVVIDGALCNACGCHHDPMRVNLGGSVLAALTWTVGLAFVIGAVLVRRAEHDLGLAMHDVGLAIVIWALGLVVIAAEFAYRLYAKDNPAATHASPLNRRNAAWLVAGTLVVVGAILLLG
jgi:hypothetical protein